MTDAAKLIAEKAKRGIEVAKLIATADEHLRSLQIEQAQLIQQCVGIGQVLGYDDLEALNAAIEANEHGLKDLIDGTEPTVENDPT